MSAAMAQHSSEVGEEDKTECMEVLESLMQNGSEGRSQEVSGALDEKAEAMVGEHQKKEEDEERGEGGEGGAKGRG